MKPLDGLFLDFYGTLVGGDRAAVEAVCRRLVADFALPITPEELSAEWGKGYFALSETCNDGHFLTLYQIECGSLVETMRPMVGRDIDPAPYVAGLTEWLRDPPVFEETLAVLAAAREAAIPTCIVSNADDEDITHAIANTGIVTECVITSEAARSYKPHAGIFETALARTGWAADRVVHVGDSLHSDVGGAKGVGLTAVWVCRAERISDIGTAQPDHELTDLRELLALIETR
jgi:2-haloalkanoic acid dehalogenase type II